MASFLIPLGLACLMVVVGLETRLSDFRALAGAPIAVAFGLTLQLAVLPGCAIALAEIFALPPAHAIGLVLLAAAPGGVTANFVTAMGRGDVALAVTLTVVTSLAAPMLLPLWVGVAFARFAAESVTLVLPYGPTFGAVFAVTVLPLAIGIVVAHRAPGRVAAARPVVRRVSTSVFLAIVAAAVVAQWQPLRTSGLALAAPTTALNLAGLAVAVAIGAIVGVGPRRVVALVLTAVLRNVALALTVAITLLGRPDVAVAATVNIVVMNLVALAVVAVRRATARGGDDDGPTHVEHA